MSALAYPDPRDGVAPAGGPPSAGPAPGEATLDASLALGAAVPAQLLEVEARARAKVYGKVSTSELSSELARSVLVEEERFNIDEMKKRAITKARSYDEFRQMVLCANLKPMQSKELADLGNSRMGKRAFGANTTATGEGFKGTGRFRRRGDHKGDAAAGVTTTTSAAAAAAAVAARLRAKQPTGPGLNTSDVKSKPKNRSEFQRDWQRNCKTTEKQARYLRFVGSGRLKKVLAKGIPSGMLGELVEALSSMVVGKGGGGGGGGGGGSDENDAAKFVYKVLRVIVGVMGFAMETMFLSAADRARVHDMLALDASASCDAAQVEAVRTAFNF